MTLQVYRAGNQILLYLYLTGNKDSKQIIVRLQEIKKYDNLVQNFEGYKNNYSPCLSRLFDSELNPINIFSHRHLQWRFWFHPAKNMIAIKWAIITNLMIFFKNLWNFRINLKSNLAIGTSSKFPIELQFISFISHLQTIDILEESSIKTNYA